MYVHRYSLFTVLWCKISVVMYMYTKRGSEAPGFVRRTYTFMPLASTQLIMNYGLRVNALKMPRTAFLAHVARRPLQAPFSSPNFRPSK